MIEHRRALVVTILAWLAVNTPLCLMIYKYDGATAATAFLYAPNQFLFLLIFFPAAFFLIYLAASTLLALISNKTSQRRLLVASWVFSILFGSAITYLDMAGSEPADIYQLSPRVAAKTVQSMKKVTEHLLSLKDDNTEKWPWAEAGKINDTANGEVASGNIQFHDIASIDTVQTAAQYLTFVGNAEHQDENNMVDTHLRAGNILELFVAMLALMHLVFWVFVAFVGKVMSVWDDAALKSAAVSLAIAVAFLMLFSIGSAFNYQVRGVFFGGVDGSARGDITGAIGTLILGSILTVVFLRNDWLATAKFVYPIILSLVALVFVTTWFSKVFSILGNANSGTTIFVLLLAAIMVVGTSLVLAIMLPANRSSV